jgi:hypothetical protein
MTDHEDLLRRALAAEADEVWPAGDGLARIQTRLAQRRRRLWRWRGLAVAMAAAVVAGGTVGGLALVSAPTRPVATHVAHRSPKAVHAVHPRPAPLTLWPASGGQPWQQDPSATASRFVLQVLRFPQLAAVTTASVGPQLAEIGIGTTLNGPTVSTVSLVKVAGDWFVTGATADELAVTSPPAGASAGGNLTIAGVDKWPNQAVNAEFVTAGTTVPIATGSTSRTFGPGTWSMSMPAPARTSVTPLVVWIDRPGTVVPMQLVVVPVRLTGVAGVPTYPTYFAGVSDGRIGAYNSSDGSFLHYLTPAGQNDSDPQLYDSGSWLYYLTNAATVGQPSCSSELWRVYTQSGSTPQPVVTGKGGLLGYAVSSDLSMVGYVTANCTTGAETLSVLNTASGVTKSYRLGSTAPPQLVGDPVFSPDGRSLTLSVNDGMQSDHLMVFDTATLGKPTSMPCRSNCQQTNPMYNAGQLLYLLRTSSASPQVEAPDGHGGYAPVLELPTSWAQTLSMSVSSDYPDAFLWTQLNVDGSMSMWSWVNGTLTELRARSTVTEVSW